MGAWPHRHGPASRRANRHALFRGPLHRHGRGRNQHPWQSREDVSRRGPRGQIPRRRPGVARHEAPPNHRRPRHHLRRRHHHGRRHGGGRTQHHRRERLSHHQRPGPFTRRAGKRQRESDEQERPREEERGFSHLNKQWQIAHWMSEMISIREIERAIIFLMAEWSGPAQWAWRELSEFLENYRGQAPNVIKLEWKDAAPVYSLPELDGKVHAWGEAFVVKNGQVVFFTVLGKEKQEIQRRCEMLVRAY